MDLYPGRFKPVLMAAFSQTFYADSSRNSLPRDELIKLKWLDNEQLTASTIGMHIVNVSSLQSRNIIIPPGN
jgi:hypothetical protein